MVHVNTKRLGKELRGEAWQRLWEAARKSGSGEAFAERLATFLTPAEITVLEKRLSIPILLARGLSYRAIGRTLDASSTTVSFVKHHLTRKPRTRRQYSPLHSPHKKRMIPPPSSSMGRGRWRWLNELGK